MTTREQLDPIIHWLEATTQAPARIASTILICDAILQDGDASPALCEAWVQYLEETIHTIRHAQVVAKEVQA